MIFLMFYLAAGSYERRNNNLLALGLVDNVIYLQMLMKVVLVV